VSWGVVHFIKGVITLHTIIPTIESHIDARMRCKHITNRCTLVPTTIFYLCAFKFSTTTTWRLSTQGIYIYIYTEIYS